jgi:hypothetical protein
MSEDKVFLACHGRQTFGSVTESVAVFGIRYPKPGEPNVEWSSKAIAANVFTKHGTMQRMDASSDGFKDHGAWYNTTYTSSAKDTHILVFMYTRRIAKQLQSQCCLNLMVSPSAPAFIDVNVDLVPNSLSALSNRITLFSGNAFVLDNDGLKKLGVIASPADLSHFMDKDEVSEEFDIVSRNGVDPKMNYMEVDDGSGETRAIPIAKPAGRRLRLRKKD